ncbi:MAG TPA: hypothetical protein VMC08_03200, partial [Bacteroidales bacterium]|nr:hypothetical protein [Bacteroidales bacterium]
MKKIKLYFFLVLILSGGKVIGQNWQYVCSPGVTLYKNEGGTVKAFRLDSLSLPGNNDTAFLSYRAIYPVIIDSCFDTTNGGILGRRVFKYHDGTFLFFNDYHDTLTLKSTASLNQAWTFCRLSDTSRIEAKVTSVILDS